MKKFGVLVVAGFIASGCFAQMFAGTITFKDGGTVDFVRLGTEDSHVCTIWGKLGAQQVEYKFGDLGQIVFSGGNFSSNKGEAVVVSKNGKRFSLTNCKVQWRSVKGSANNGEVYYRYLDPVTNLEQTGRESCENIASITIEGAGGDVKKNPTTGEYFPSMYNFDPFTGEKLVWAKRAE